MNNRYDFSYYFTLLIDLANFQIVHINLFSYAVVVVIDELLIHIHYLLIVVLVIDDLAELRDELNQCIPHSPVLLIID